MTIDGQPFIKSYFGNQNPPWSCTLTLFYGFLRKSIICIPSGYSIGEVLLKCLPRRWLYLLYHTRNITEKLKSKNYKKLQIYKIKNRTENGWFGSSRFVGSVWFSVAFLNRTSSRILNLPGPSGEIWRLYWPSSKKKKNHVYANSNI